VKCSRLYLIKRMCLMFLKVFLLTEKNLGEASFFIDN